MAAPERATGSGADDDGPGDPEEVARIICLRQLESRARTRAELEQTLRKRGVPVEPAVRVLDRLTAVGLIDDAAYARDYTLSQHRERRLAGRAVAQQLRRRGVAAETIDSAVSLIDADSERGAAEELVSARLRGMTALAPEAKARRLLGLLARRGYGSELAHGVVRAALSAELELSAESDGQP